jgi:hypothetical protein
VSSTVNPQFCIGKAYLNCIITDIYGITRTKLLLFSHPPKVRQDENQARFRAQPFIDLQTGGKGNGDSPRVRLPIQLTNGSGDVITLFARSNTRSQIPPEALRFSNQPAGEIQ